MAHDLLENLRQALAFSPRLGVRERPVLRANHASSVPGLHIVGDLGDAPLIKVALRQGYDTAQQLAQELALDPSPPATPGPAGHDVVIVGAGPAGIGAALACQDAGLSFVVLEKDTPLQTLENFPRGKMLYAEPAHIDTPAALPFVDDTKEAIVARWRAAIATRQLPVHAQTEVVDIQRDAAGFQLSTTMRPEPGLPNAPIPVPSGAKAYHARRVILAIGRRAAVTRLGVPGEDLPHVAHHLSDPAAYRGRRVLVVGGGDSALEAAVACAAQGAKVALSYRQQTFSRARPQNQAALAALVQKGQVVLHLRTTPQAIDEAAVTLKGEGGLEQIPADHVLVLIGTTLPRSFLRRLGVRLEGAWRPARLFFVLGFAALTYLFYVVKQKQSFYPFGPGDPLHHVPTLLQQNFGWRAVDGGFWGSLLYTLAILVFGVRAYRRYAGPVQKRRYLSLMAFQAIALFGVPELLAPLFMNQPWKLYALSVPWPLSIWSAIEGPAWGGHTPSVGLGWILVGALVSFVAIPLYVRRHGTQFCSYLCGCGGLAETVGDLWRHLAPRGKNAYRAEWLGKLIFLLAIPTTLLILNDAWDVIRAAQLRSAQVFAQKWYGLVVDFGLASVVGVAAYPYLGNRIWCRFFCPLRAYMELLSKWFSRLTIRSNPRCIGCGECTRSCQMGIDVQQFAQRREDLDNTNSSCIQCGICIEVCPMDVLSLHHDARPGRRPPRSLPVLPSGAA